jgi:hypothetical protein
MRLLLALLAIVGLLASPVTAAAAQARCGHASGSAMVVGMDMSAMGAMDHSGTQRSVGDPCCDPSGHHKTADRSCDQLCAAACAVAIALPTRAGGLISVSHPAAEFPAPLVSAHPFEPPGLKRPPRSIV